MAKIKHGLAESVKGKETIGGAHVPFNTQTGTPSISH